MNDYKVGDVMMLDIYGPTKAIIVDEVCPNYFKINVYDQDMVTVDYEDWVNNDELDEMFIDYLSPEVEAQMITYKEYYDK